MVIRNKIAGIDYSLTSPSLCIFTGGNIDDFNNFEFFNLNSSKSDIQHLNTFNNIQAHLHSDNYFDFIERYDIISDFFIDKLNLFKVKDVVIEGYSFGSSGSRLFQLVENTAVLKYKIRKGGFNLSIVPPTTVKKFFTGSGRAGKELMYESFLDNTGVDIAKTIKKRSNSPYSDIVDSYAICLYNLKQKNEKKN